MKVEQAKNAIKNRQIVSYRIGDNWSEFLMSSVILSLNNNQWKWSAELKVIGRDEIRRCDLNRVELVDKVFER